MARRCLIVSTEANTASLRKVKNKEVTVESPYKYRIRTERVYVILLMQGKWLGRASLATLLTVAKGTA